MTIAHKIRRADAGLTLVEAIAALAIFLIVLGFMIPMFANQRLSKINNQIKTGAIAVSQEILDQIRQVDIATLPTSGSATTLPFPPNESFVDKEAMGIDHYRATITYCANTAYCNPNARHIKVEVSHHGQIVYTVETVYTRLQ